MGHLRTGLWTALCTLSFLSSCTLPATQLLVVVDTDIARLPAGGCFGVVVSRVIEPNGIEPDATRSFFRTPAPFSFGITPPGNDFTRRVQVSVEVLTSRQCSEQDPVGRVRRRTVRTGFVNHQTLRLPLFLSDTCPELGCDDGTTCQEGAPMCVPVPDVPAMTLTPVVPGEEFMVVAPDAGSQVDANVPDANLPDADVARDANVPDANLPDANVASDANVPDANLPDANTVRDAGMPPACTPLATAAYQGALYVTPMTVAPRFTSVGWRVYANTGSSTTYWSTGLSDAPTGGGTLLLDTTGFSSLGALATLASTTLPASDSITVLGSPSASNEVYRWTPMMLASTVVSTLGPLRPEGAIAHLGADLLYAISDASNRTAIIRASTPTLALYTTTETNRESALAALGTGALVAFGEGATPGRCEVRPISAASIVGPAINVPVAGQCAHVAIASLGMNRTVLVYVASSGGVNEVFAQELNLMTSSLSGAPIALGPARGTLPARPQVWADASGAFRAVWPMDAAVGTASVVSGSVVTRQCISGPASTQYQSVRSARQGATTFVLVQGGGRSMQGLQYATITD